MVDSAYSDSFGHKYSVDFSFDKKPFVTYPVAYFTYVHDAYNWLSDLHKLILREHIIQITDSAGTLIFNLSHLFEFDDNFHNGHFKTTQIWFVLPEDLEQLDLEQLDLDF